MKQFKIKPWFNSLLIVSCLQFIEQNMGKLNDFHKSDEINKLFKNQYNEEVVNKIRNFYFGEGDLDNEITKFEYICHVSGFDVISLCASKTSEIINNDF